MTTLDPYTNLAYLENNQPAVALINSWLVALAAGGSRQPEVIAIPCSDLVTALTAGTTKGYLRMPFAFTVTGVKASVLTAPTGSGNLTVDINDSGTTILSTKITFDASEKTTATAATPAVVSDAALANDAEITVDIDAVSGTITGAGLVVYITGYRA